jgi:hypothetical protein
MKKMTRVLLFAALPLAAMFMFSSYSGAPAGKCPEVDPLDHTVILANINDCSSYFMCSDGVPILQKCPEGLHFNPNLNVCEWPADAGCGNYYILDYNFPIIEEKCPECGMTCTRRRIKTDCLSGGSEKCTTKDYMVSYDHYCI